MSDYAGPILGAVGAVIGGYFGGPGGAQLGWAIGSAIGGAYAASQQVVPGPKIGDVQKQTSQEGGFRPIVYGRSHPIMGNVLADGGPVIVKKEESQGGKGGPKVETEYAYRTYAVGFCEGESILLQAWRNGILVYNPEDPSMAAENSKFLEYATWYTGSFSQTPSPDLEAIFGVGNAPAFRGTSYLVLANEDVTDQRAAWSQWQVRVLRGSGRVMTSAPYPIYGIEEFGSTGEGQAGYLLAATEQFQMIGSGLDGALNDLVISFVNGPESFEFSGTALDGARVDLVQIYSGGPETFEFTGAALNGEIWTSLVIYTAPAPAEAFEFTGSALDGSLT